MIMSALRAFQPSLYRIKTGG